MIDSTSDRDSDELGRCVLKWGRELQSWNLPWTSGIYPGEMAAFLALCELHGVKGIIESGRGEAYSTRVLGEYATRTGIPVISIDLEPDPRQAAAMREHLRRYPGLRCLIGDAFKILPEAAALLPPPLGLLIDGPKEWAANRLSAVACAMFPVRVVGHHNSELVTAWGREFARAFPGAFVYEEMGLSQRPEWKTFKEWERETVKGYELSGIPGRSLENSSLALAVVRRRGGGAIRSLLGIGRTRLVHHPLVLWLRWSLRRGPRPARA